MITITEVSTGPVQVNINPTTLELGRGESYRFQPQILNSNTRKLIWSVTGNGSVDSKGLYTAPSSYNATDEYDCVYAKIRTKASASGCAFITLKENRSVDLVASSMLNYASKLAGLCTTINHQFDESSTNPYSITGYVFSNNVRGESYGNSGIIPIHNFYQIDFESDSPIGQVTGYISSNGCSSLPTYLNQIGDQSFIYSAVVSGISPVSESSCLGWPDGASVGTDTLHFNVPFNCGFTLSKEVQATWFRGDMTFHSTAPKGSDGQVLLSPSGSPFYLNFDTRDEVLPSVAVSVSGSGSYNPSTYTYTPSTTAVDGDYDTIYVAAVDIPEQVFEFKFFYKVY